MSFLRIACIVSLFLSSPLYALDLQKLGEKEQDIVVSFNDFAAKVTKESFFTLLQKRTKTLDCQNIFNGLLYVNQRDYYSLDATTPRTIEVDLDGELTDPDDKNMNLTALNEWKIFTTKGQKIYLSPRSTLYLILRNSYGFPGEYSARQSNFRDIENKLREFSQTLASYYHYREYIKNSDSDSITENYKARAEEDLQKISGMMQQWKEEGAEDIIFSVAQDYDKFLEQLFKQHSDYCYAQAHQQEIEIQKQIDTLIANFSTRLNLPPAVLRKKFQTNSGMGVSGNISTLAEFLENLGLFGNLSAEYVENSIIITQKVNDSLASHVNINKYQFVPMPGEPDTLFLNRAILDNEEYPPAKLVFLVMTIDSAAKQQKLQQTTAEVPSGNTTAALPVNNEQPEKEAGKSADNLNGDERELNFWRQIGVSEYQLSPFTSHGMKLQEASSWFQAMQGFKTLLESRGSYPDLEKLGITYQLSYSNINALQRAGFNPEMLAQWGKIECARDFTVSDFSAMQRNHIGIEDFRKYCELNICRDYLSTIHGKGRIEDLADWISLGIFEKSQKNCFRPSREFNTITKNNITVDELKQVHEQGLKLSEYIDFKEHGLSPADVAALQHTGLKKHSLIRLLDSQNFTASEIVEWSDTGVDPIFWPKYQKADVTPKYAKTLIQFGVHEDVIDDLMKSGFTLEHAQMLQQKQIEPARWTEWKNFLSATQANTERQTNQLQKPKSDQHAVTDNINSTAETPRKSSNSMMVERLEKNIELIQSRIDATTNPATQKALQKSLETMRQRLNEIQQKGE